MTTLATDIRSAWRRLTRAAGFTAAAAIVLAVGIGASTAMFAQVDAIYFQPLPVTAPQQLRSLSWTTRPQVPRRYSAVGRFSYPAYLLVRDHARSFADVACWSGAYVNVPALGRLEAQVVSGNYFRTLGAAPMLGRAILPDDERAGAFVAVMSDALWRRGFAADPAVLGRTVRVNNAPVTIVGVMSPSFYGVNPNRAADMFLSLPMYSLARFEVTAPRRLDDDRDWSACELVARLRPGVSDAAARTEVVAVLRDAGMAPAPGAGASAADRDGQPLARHGRPAPRERGESHGRCAVRNPVGHRLRQIRVSSGGPARLARRAP
jgi:hypothetical protein